MCVCVCVCVWSSRVDNTDSFEFLNIRLYRPLLLAYSLDVIYCPQRADWPWLVCVSVWESKELYLLVIHWFSRSIQRVLFVFFVFFSWMFYGKEDE